MRTVSLLALVCALSSGSVVREPTSPGLELIILHNNDMHAHFEQTSQLSGVCTPEDRDAGKCYGGFPRVAHVVKEHRAAAAAGGPPVLYLNAGDTYTGTAWFTLYKWRIAADFINALQPDAVSLGNHEFDNGVSGLTPFIENVTTPVLASNLILINEPELQQEPNLKKSVVFDINGVKVGVIGYLTPDTQFLAIKNNVQYIEEVTAIREEAKKLKEQGINILIALGHSGFTKDLQIAKEVEDIDLVIGGHTNTFLWNGTIPDVEVPEGPYPTLVNQASGRIVPAVQAYAYTKYLGKLHLLFNANGEIIDYDGNPILLDKTVPQDPEVLKIIDRYRENVTRISNEVLGTTKTVLDGHTCRLQECNFGNLIADAMIHEYASKYVGGMWTDAPIAIIQGGGIRASVAHTITPTPVTRGDLLSVMPFDGNLVVVSMNGSTILQMLEHAVASYNKVRPPGQFLQFSGLKVVYDLSKPPGRRVVKASARCTCGIPKYSSLLKAQPYRLLMPSFLSLGGDGFKMFAGLPIKSLKYNELEATSNYIRSHDPVYPALENRITLLNADKLPNGSDAPTLSFACMLAVIAVLTAC